MLIGSMVQHNVYRGAMASRTLAALLAMVEKAGLTHLFPFPFLALGFIITVLYGYLKGILCRHPCPVLYEKGPSRLVVDKAIA